MILEAFGGASRATLGFLAGWKGYAAAAVIGAAGAGWAAHTVTAMAWRADYEAQRATFATQQASQANAAVQQLTADVGRIHGAATDLANWLPGFNAQMAGISKGLRDAISANPLPVDCQFDADRLRALNAATDAANAARTTGQYAGPGLPGNTTGGQHQP